MPHIQQDMLPAGGIVTGPDTAIATCSDITGATEYQITVIQQFRKTFGSGADHITAIDIVYIIMTDPLAVHLMEDIPIIPDGCPITGISSQAREDKIQNLLHSLGTFGIFGIEQGRLVHIVPKAFNALIRIETVLQTEPTAGLGI